LEAIPMAVGYGLAQFRASLGMEGQLVWPDSLPCRAGLGFL
jgi:hypothetical protein